MSHNGPKWTREYIAKQSEAARRDLETRVPRASVIALGRALKAGGWLGEYEKCRAYYAARYIGGVKTPWTHEYVEKLLVEFGLPPARPRLMR